MTSILGNPILLSSVLENLSSGRDIASLCCLNQVIRETAISIIHHCHIIRLSLNGRTRLKSKTLLQSPFRVLEWRSLQSLNLSETSVTSAIIRSLLFESTTLHVLQILDCPKINVAQLISLLRSIVRLRFGKKAKAKDSFAPLMVLDCWGIAGLSLDYKYQNKREWMYESFCNDNKNLQILLVEAELLGIDLNIRFCPGEDHNHVTDIRYLPAARQRWGMSPCELMPDEVILRCDTCILRNHNRLGNPKHKCRTPEIIRLDELHGDDPVS